MNNRLIDIHNNLMSTLEDLDDPDLYEDGNEDRLKKLCKIAHAKSLIAKEIVEVDLLAVRAMENGTDRIMASDVLSIEESK